MTQPLPGLAAQSFDLGSPGTRTACLIAFTAVATLTLLLCVLTGPDRDDLDEFYTGSRTLSPLQNGFAVAGDYISAATLLGTIGVIALTGYDGVVLALSTALSLVLLMFLLAEPLRNAGRFTMGDAFARRLGPSPGDSRGSSRSDSRGIRIAACAATLAALLPLMVVQLAVAGEVLVFILGVDRPGLRAGCILLLGALMISYAAIGGMKGTALIQLIKMVLLLGAGALLAGLVLHRFGWSPGALLSAAERGSGAGPRFLESGLQFASGGSAPQLDMITSELTVVLGGACLPHVTMRMYAPRSAPDVRRSMSWAVSSVAVFALLISVIGFGATALVGREQLAASDGQGNTALLLTAQAVFGPESPTLETFVFTAVTAMVFLTVLASVAGMILACANSLAHDVFARRPDSAAGTTARRELLLARASTAGVGLTAIALAVSVQHLNLQPLVSMSFCLGASALAPALVYSLFWRRYTRTGLLWTLVGGTLAVLVLLPGTNLVSGGPGSAFPDHDFNWFPFTTTGIASIPLGFLLGWLGTLLTPPRTRANERHQYEMVEGWILAGAQSRGTSPAPPGKSSPSGA